MFSNFIVYESYNLDIAKLFCKNIKEIFSFFKKVCS